MGKDLSSSSDIYLVETYWPGVTEPAVRAAVQRARAAVEQKNGLNGEVSYVTSYLVGRDEVAFFLFRAGSVLAIEQVCRRADVAFDRIVRIVQIEVD